MTGIKLELGAKTAKKISPNKLRRYFFVKAHTIDEIHKIILMAGSSTALRCVIVSLP
jgi:hypothetical protein